MASAIQGTRARRTESQDKKRISNQRSCAPNLHALLVNWRISTRITSLISARPIFFEVRIHHKTPAHAKEVHVKRSRDREGILE